MFDVVVNNLPAEEIEVEIILIGVDTSEEPKWRSDDKSGARTSSYPKGCSISSPAATKPRYMNAAIATPGIVNHPNWSTSWKGRKKRYSHTVLQKDKNPGHTRL